MMAGEAAAIQRAYAHTYICISLRVAAAVFRQDTQRSRVSCARSEIGPPINHDAVVRERLLPHATLCYRVRYARTCT